MRLSLALIGFSHHGLRGLPFRWEVATVSFYLQGRWDQVLVESGSELRVYSHTTRNSKGSFPETPLLVDSAADRHSKHNTSEGHQVPLLIGLYLQVQSTVLLGLQISVPDSRIVSLNRGDSLVPCRRGEMNIKRDPLLKRLRVLLGFVA